MHLTVRYALAGLALLAMATAACSSSTPPATPSATTAPSVAAAATPAPSLTPLPSPTPEATPSAEITPLPTPQSGTLFEYTYAVQLLHSRLYKDAIPVFTVVIRRMPELASAWRGRGVAYHNEKQLDLALEDLNEAIKLNPKYADAFRDRGVLNRDMGQKDKAIADLQTALTLYDVVRQSRQRQEVIGLLNEIRR